METCTKSIDSISPLLFLDDDGEPLQFSVRGSEKYFKSIIEKIQKGNGVVNVRRNGPFTIVLDLPSARFFGEDEVFSVQFISDSCEADALQDLNKYRLNKQSQYAEDFDFNKVMLKNTSWNDVPLESRSSKPQDEFELMNHKSMLKTVSRPYGEKERLAIINFIIEHEAYHLVGGDRLWIEMEKDKVCEGRSWHSLKNHFKRTIFPQIGSYGLSKEIIRNFKDRTSKY